MGNFTKYSKESIYGTVLKKPTYARGKYKYHVHRYTGYL
jgi:hypothetical protein